MITESDKYLLHCAVCISMCCRCWKISNLRLHQQKSLQPNTSWENLPKSPPTHPLALRGKHLQQDSQHVLLCFLDLKPLKDADYLSHPPNKCSPPSSKRREDMPPCDTLRLWQTASVSVANPFMCVCMHYLKEQGASAAFALERVLFERRHNFPMGQKKKKKRKYILFHAGLWPQVSRGGAQAPWEPSSKMTLARRCRGFWVFEAASITGA